MTDTRDDSFNDTLARWKSTESSASEELDQVLNRIFKRMSIYPGPMVANAPRPRVIWVDSPGQLAVAPFLRQLLNFVPSEYQKNKLGPDFDFDVLRQSIRQALEASLTDPIWCGVLRAVISQEPPLSEKDQLDLSMDETVPAYSVAATDLFPSDTELNWDDREKVYNTMHDGPERSLQSSRHSTLPRFQKYRSWLLSTHGEYTPVGVEALCRSAFEQSFYADTGLKVREVDGSRAPSCEERHFLSRQFEQQMGDTFCQEVSILLASIVEYSIARRGYRILDALYGQSRVVPRGFRVRTKTVPLLPKMFFDKNFAGMKSLLQVQILDDIFNSYEPVWGSWSLDSLRVTMELIDTTKDREKLLDLQKMLDAAFMYVFEENIVYACRKPISLHFDNRGGLHSYTEPAIEFADSSKMYFWQNVRVSEELVTKPEILTVPYICAEPNKAVQQVLIEKYGRDRFLEETDDLTVGMQREST